jgi:serine/threonine protein kinase
MIQISPITLDQVVEAIYRLSGKAYALKILDKRHIVKEKKVKYVHVEKEALNLLADCPSVIRLHWTFQDQQSLYFVLDLVERGEILTFIKQVHFYI